MQRFQTIFGSRILSANLETHCVFRFEANCCAFMKWCRGPGPRYGHPVWGFLPALCFWLQPTCTRQKTLWLTHSLFRWWVGVEEGKEELEKNKSPNCDQLVTSKKHILRTIHVVTEECAHIPSVRWDSALGASTTQWFYYTSFDRRFNSLRWRKFTGSTLQIKCPYKNQLAQGYKWLILNFNCWKNYRPEILLMQLYITIHCRVNQIIDNILNW